MLKGAELVRNGLWSYEFLIRWLCDATPTKLSPKHLSALCNKPTRSIGLLFNTGAYFRASLLAAPTRSSFGFHSTKILEFTSILVSGQCRLQSAVTSFRGGCL